MNQPTIKIIATGGTIAGAGFSQTMTTGYQPGALAIEDLSNDVPDLDQLATMEMEQLLNIDSVDMIVISHGL